MTVFSCRHVLFMTLALVAVVSAGSPTHTTPHYKARGLVAGEPVSSFYPRQFDSEPGGGDHGGRQNEARTYNDAWNNGNGYDDNDGGGNNYPSPSQRPRARNLSPRLLSTVPPSQLAESICPSGLYGCPISNAGSLAALPTSLSDWTEQGFECVDTKADLRACGGCASLDTRHDCTAIEGANDISCVAGTCVVDSCLPGYSLDSKNNACTHT